MVMQIDTVDVLEEFLETRSPELREKLVLQSVPLVHYLLGRMGVAQEKSNDYEDLAHQGLMGLIEAVDRFDPKFNARFSTYAALRIRGKILDYLRATDWMPRAVRKRTRLIQKTITNLWTENLREPTEEEIASRIGTDVKEVQQGLDDLNRALVSLDMVMSSNEEDGGALYERLGDEKQANPADEFEKEDLIEEMSSAIQELSEREQLVLSLYYNEELTFRQIGQVMDISESRACQLHACAISSLKARMNDE
jgi:RNA polymerase sigma factor for flagellar operon FliA